MKALAISQLGIWLMAGYTGVGAELSDFTTSLFSGAANCAFCHDPWSPGDTRSGAVLATHWRATMMANAFQDPLWRAAMAHETARHPGLKTFVEDKCQTCHAPLARAQARLNGTNPFDLVAALKSPLAGEGVGCTFCHQLQTRLPGTPVTSTSPYSIGTNRVIYGPYKDVITMPMLRHVDYTPAYGSQIHDSALCATCHTLFTPILEKTGGIQGQFPEQVPYLEWSRSKYAREGRHCQDCHMPRIDTPVKVSSRPPWLENRAPFWEHRFVGGNAFMLESFADNARRLQPSADSRQLRTMAQHARDQLRQAARLHVRGERQGEEAVLRVTVENLTGHKLPTGHPYRRVWLHVTLRDARRKVLFESGSMEKTGAIRGLRNGFAPHHDVITRPDQVQVYQAVMAESDGAATWSLLSGAAYLKDNRIPPGGFEMESVPREVAVCGEAERDPNFNAEGSGKDEVVYRIPASSKPLTAEIRLLYQSVPPEAVNHLLADTHRAGQEFRKMFKGRRNAPEVLATAELEL